MRYTSHAAHSHTSDHSFALHGIHCSENFHSRTIIRKPPYIHAPKHSTTTVKIFGGCYILTKRLKNKRNGKMVFLNLAQAVRRCVTNSQWPSWFTNIFKAILCDESGKTVDSKFIGSTYHFCSQAHINIDLICVALLNVDQNWNLTDISFKWKNCKQLLRQMRVLHKY
jgi:hypothetical protein